MLSLHQCYRLTSLYTSLKPSEGEFEIRLISSIVSTLCVFVLVFHSLNETWYSLEDEEQNQTTVQCSYEWINCHRPWLPKHEITETATIKIMRQTVLAQEYQSLKQTVFHVTRRQCSKQAPHYLEVMDRSRLWNKVLTSMAESRQ
jgi:hypothetical protein